MKGRPTRYNQGYCEQAEKLCRLGATDADLAAFFQVTETTINNWKLAHPDFFESIKKGKVITDMEIANSLYKRAKGCTIVQQQAIKVKQVKYKAGKKVSETESVEVVELQQQQPPDTTAAIFWLKNRNKDNWKDKQEVENSGSISIVWNEERTYEAK